MAETAIEWTDTRLLDGVIHDGFPGVAVLENFAREVCDCAPDLFGVDHDLTSAEVIEAFQADAFGLIGGAA
jgi:hypothetical protein